MRVRGHPTLSHGVGVCYIVHDVNGYGGASRGPRYFSGLAHIRLISCPSLDFSVCACVRARARVRCAWLLAVDARGLFLRLSLCVCPAS